VLSAKQPNSEPKPITTEEATIQELGLTEESVVLVKNLGKQIGWSTVYYLEYLGPIVIVPALYAIGDRKQYGLSQHLAAGMAVAHFLKRELETKYVHVFSRKTMPFKRVFINCAHYWGLFALLNGIELFLTPKGKSLGPKASLLLLVLWLLFQFCNLKCHKELAGLRKGDTSRRGIPEGWGFSLVSCANYLWETLGWVAFSALARTYAAWLFTAVSATQMAIWARKKRAMYVKEFGDKYPRGCKAIFPFLL
jgi:very-long-chain enoyl-CoA reductase